MHKSALRVLLAGFLSPLSAIAQVPLGVPQGLDQINATLNALIATVNQQSARITQLANSIPTPPPSPTTLVSPVLWASDQAGCSVVNAGTTTATSIVMTLRGIGNVAIGGEATVPSLAPGTGYVFTQAANTAVYCRIDSPQAGQLRGMLLLRDSNGKPQDSVEAH